MKGNCFLRLSSSWWPHLVHIAQNLLSSLKKTLSANTTSLSSYQKAKFLNEILTPKPQFSIELLSPLKLTWSSSFFSKPPTTEKFPNKNNEEFFKSIPVIFSVWSMKRYLDRRILRRTCHTSFERKLQLRVHNEAKSLEYNNMS